MRVEGATQYLLPTIHGIADLPLFRFRVSSAHQSIERPAYFRSSAPVAGRIPPNFPTTHYQASRGDSQ